MMIMTRGWWWGWWFPHLRNRQVDALFTWWILWFFFWAHNELVNGFYKPTNTVGGASPCSIILGKFCGDLRTDLAIDGWDWGNLPQLALNLGLTNNATMTITLTLEYTLQIAISYMNDTRTLEQINTRAPDQHSGYWYPRNSLFHTTNNMRDTLWYSNMTMENPPFTGDFPIETSI